MNWNGQRQIVDHLIAKRSDPASATRLQSEFNQKRRAKVQTGVTTRPVFMPLQFTLPAAGQVSGVRDVTEAVNFDVIITGIKTDVQTRDIIFRRTEDEKPIAYVGDELNLFLRADEIAGLSATSGGGQIGTFYLPSPIILPSGNRITVEMFKSDVTATEEIQNIVLIGFRVFNKTYGSEAIDPAEKQRIEALISMREAPRVVFLKQLVEFDSAAAGGEARNLFTPAVEEPLLVRGVRTTLRHSEISLSVSGEPRWTVKPTPIWALAAEDETIHDNYQWFSRPIFLHSKNTIEIERITNSIDGTNIDPQSTGTITWICETV